MAERKLPKTWAVLRTSKDGKTLFDRLVTSYQPRADSTVSWRLSERIKSIESEANCYIIKTYDGEEFVCRPFSEGVSQIALENISQIVNTTKEIYGGETEIIMMHPSKCYDEEADNV